MDLQPANIDQLVRGVDGHWHVIPAEDSHIVKQICEIDDSLRVRYSEAGEYFVVYQVLGEDRTEHLVTTAQELDERLVKRIQYISSSQYDYAAELEKIDAEKKKKEEYESEQRIGEVGERLHYAMRKDLGKTKPKFKAMKGISGARNSR